ncbi:MAG: glycosyltransferase family 4 protein [Flavobacteriales bacterium]
MGRSIARWHQVLKMGQRVAYLTHYAELYGANRSLLDLVLCARNEHGVKPLVIIAEEGPLLEALEANGVECAVIPFVPWMHKQVYMGGPHHRLMQWWRYRQQGKERDRWNAEQMPELIRRCKQWNVDLVHVNSSVIGLGPELANACAIPLVWHIRELPFAHYEFRVDGGTERYCKALRAADRIIAISEAVRADVGSLIGNGSHITIVGNGVADTARMLQLEQASSERWSSTGPFTFLQLAIFHPSKGQLDAVEAFAQLHAQEPDTRLILAGGGAQEEARARIKALGISDSVELPGYINDPFAAMAQAHCLLQCSKDEAMGRATVEAMASGLPVIGHASGATPELIAAGTSGHLYAGIDELVQHMLDLVRNKERAARMGAGGHMRVQHSATIEAMTQAVVRVYATLCAGS